MSGDENGRIEGQADSPVPPGEVHEYVSYQDEDDGTLAKAPTLKELLYRMVVVVFGHLLRDPRRQRG